MGLPARLRWPRWSDRVPARAGEEVGSMDWGLQRWSGGTPGPEDTRARARTWSSASPGRRCRLSKRRLHRSHQRRTPPCAAGGRSGCGAESGARSRLGPRTSERLRAEPARQAPGLPQQQCLSRPRIPGGRRGWGRLERSGSDRKPRAPLSGRGPKASHRTSLRLGSSSVKWGHCGTHLREDCCEAQLR